MFLTSSAIWRLSVRHRVSWTGQEEIHNNLIARYLKINEWSCMYFTGQDKQTIKKNERKIVIIYLPISLNICFECTKEPSHWYIFIKFAYLFILILSSQWWRGFAEHHFGRSRSLSENAHKSWTAPYILIKSCMLIHLTRICQGYVRKVVVRCWYTENPKTNTFINAAYHHGLHCLLR